MIDATLYLTVWLRLHGLGVRSMRREDIERVMVDFHEALERERLARAEFADFNGLEDSDD